MRTDSCRSVTDVDGTSFNLDRLGLVTLYETECLMHIEHFVEGISLRDIKSRLFSIMVSAHIFYPINPQGTHTHDNTRRGLIWFSAPNR